MLNTLFMIRFQRGSDYLNKLLNPLLVSVIVLREAYRKFTPMGGHFDCNTDLRKSIRDGFTIKP
jgi:hypothetical protein